jgi:hypothetical protein
MPMSVDMNTPITEDRLYKLFGFKTSPLIKAKVNFLRKYKPTGNTIALTLNPNMYIQPLPALRSKKISILNTQIETLYDAIKVLYTIYIMVAYKYRELRATYGDENIGEPLLVYMIERGLIADRTYALGPVSLQLISVLDGLQEDIKTFQTLGSGEYEDTDAVPSLLYAGDTLLPSLRPDNKLKSFEDEIYGKEKSFINILKQGSLIILFLRFGKFVPLFSIISMIISIFEILNTIVLMSRTNINVTIRQIDTEIIKRSATIFAEIVDSIDQSLDETYRQLK